MFLYPASETEFFLKYGPERFSFIKDKGTMSLIMHRGGTDIVVEKVK